VWVTFFWVSLSVVEATPFASVTALAVCVPSLEAERLHLVVATSANKDLAGIAAALAPLVDRIIVTRNDSDGGADPGRRRGRVRRRGEDRAVRR
jgi:folylpolyglutamate synthase/dihydropteroate synthase